MQCFSSALHVDSSKIQGVSDAIYAEDAAISLKSGAFAVTGTDVGADGAIAAYQTQTDDTLVWKPDTVSTKQAMAVSPSDCRPIRPLTSQRCISQTLKQRIISINRLFGRYRTTSQQAQRCLRSLLPTAVPVRKMQRFYGGRQGVRNRRTQSCRLRMFRQEAGLKKRFAGRMSRALQREPPRRHFHRIQRVRAGRL